MKVLLLVLLSLASLQLVVAQQAVDIQKIGKIKVAALPKDTPAGTLPVVTDEHSKITVMGAVTVQSIVEPVTVRGAVGITNNPQNYEYEVRIVNMMDQTNIDHLNALGGRGFELVSANPYTGKIPCTDPPDIGKGILPYLFIWKKIKQ